MTARKKTCLGTKKKEVVLKELTSLKLDGGILEGTPHQDTYDTRIKKAVAKKAAKKDARKKAAVAAKMKNTCY